MSSKSKTSIYFILVFLGGGFLLFREEVEGELQIILTVIAVCIMMFGLYKVTSMQASNKKQEYKDQEYFNREKYSQQEAFEEE